MSINSFSFQFIFSFCVVAFVLSFFRFISLSNYPIDMNHSIRKEFGQSINTNKFEKMTTTRGVTRRDNIFLFQSHFAMVKCKLKNSLDFRVFFFFNLIDLNCILIVQPQIGSLSKHWFFFLNKKMKKKLSALVNHKFRTCARIGNDCWLFLFDLLSNKISMINRFICDRIVALILQLYWQNSACKMTNIKMIGSSYLSHNMINCVAFHNFRQ